MKILKKLKLIYLILIIFLLTSNLWTYAAPGGNGNGGGGGGAPPAVVCTSVFTLDGSTTPTVTTNLCNNDTITVTTSGSVISDAAFNTLTIVSTTSGASINNSGTIKTTNVLSSAIYIERNQKLVGLTNLGTVSGGLYGIDNRTSDGGTITNLTNSGIINGGTDGISNTGTITTFTNSGRVHGGADGIFNHGNSTKITTLINSGTINGGSGKGISNNGTITTLTNTGTISGGTYSISNTATLDTINLDKGSVLIGAINSTGDYTLNMNVGASKSYYVSTSGAGIITLNDLNNRPAVRGSALAINIGSMEMAGENLLQKTANIAEAIDRNVKHNKGAWFERYDSESTRDSAGESSQTRQFKNNSQGINAGFKIENEGQASPLQVILNIDQTKNNIDRLEHVIRSESVMIGVVDPMYAKHEGFDVSVKGLIGYANSKTDRKILDNTSSTGERTLTGEYNSYYVVVGSALSKNNDLENDLKANLVLGLDLSSEFRDSYSENLYFKYHSLDLVQLQPRIQSEFIHSTGKASNVFLTAGLGARAILFGNNQKYTMNNTGVSFTAPTAGDFASLAVGANINVIADVNFYALVSTKMSDNNQSTNTNLFSIGLKGTF